MQVGLIKVPREAASSNQCLWPHEVADIHRPGVFGVMLQASQGRPRYTGRPTTKLGGQRAASVGEARGSVIGKATCASYPPAMRAPFVYRVTAVCVFLMGFALHLTNVVIGPDRLVAKVFSPRVEIVFAVMMIVAAISGWMSLKRLSSRGLLRVVYWFALILITLSIPIHVRSVIIWSTAWVHAFPKYYSHMETPMFLALAYAVTRFRFR